MLCAGSAVAFAEGRRAWRSAARVAFARPDTNGPAGVLEVERAERQLGMLLRRMRAYRRAPYNFASSRISNDAEFERCVDLATVLGLRIGELSGASIGAPRERERMRDETPDGHALVPGVLRDAEGKNITRSQVSDIPGAIPTFEVTGNRGPRLATAPTQIPAATAATLAAIEKGAYGTIGPAAAPQLFMLIDPQCVYSGGGQLPGLDPDLVLTKEERKQLKAEYADQCPAYRPAGGTGPAGGGQRHLSPQRRHGRAAPRLRRPRAVGAARPRVAVARSIRTRRSGSRARRCIARQRAPSGRRACRATRVMARCSRGAARSPAPEHLLWPPMRDQMFYADAVTTGGQRVGFGDNAYSAVDINLGPEDPRPFMELVATLGRDRIPWRAAIVVEGCGRSAMQLKDIGASFLSMFPGNNDLRRAFAFLRQARERRFSTTTVRARG